MSRSGYTDDCDDNWSMIRWRGAVSSAIRGKRGQAFLREMRDAMDALPEKRLIADELVNNGEACAIGTVGLKRGVDMSKLDPEDYDAIASAFGIPMALVREIEFENDEDIFGRDRTPEQRFTNVRRWLDQQILEG